MLTSFNLLPIAAVSDGSPAHFQIVDTFRARCVSRVIPLTASFGIDFISVISIQLYHETQVHVYCNYQNGESSVAGMLFSGDNLLGRHDSSLLLPGTVSGSDST